MRIVVAGQLPNGRSGFVRDVQGEHIPGPEGDVYLLWGRDDRPPYELPASDSPMPSTMFPAAGGVRVLTVKLRPTEHRAAAEVHTSASEDTDFPDLEEGGFHRTDTVDIVFMISGEVVLLADDGEKVLHAGDTVVQLGARHAWHNRSGEPAVFGLTTLGGRRKP
jgi:hypothetical protein